MNPPSPTVQPTSRSYDQGLIRKEGDRTRWIAYWVMVAPGILLLVVSAYSWFAFPSWWSPSGPGTILGVAILGLGLVIIPTIARAAVNPLIRVELDHVRVQLIYRRGSAKNFAWTDPTVSGALTRITSAKPTSESGGSNAWNLSLRSAKLAASAWVTSETGEGILEIADQLGKAPRRMDRTMGSGPGHESVFTTATFGRSTP